MKAKSELREMWGMFIGEDGERYLRPIPHLHPHRLGTIGLSMEEKAALEKITARST